MAPDGLAAQTKWRQIAQMDLDPDDPAVAWVVPDSQGCFQMTPDDPR